MGGNAFNQTLASTSFPRIPSPVYNALKTRFLSRLQELYNHVGVPVEAPEKITHGDLDFIVSDPIIGDDESPDGQTLLDRVTAALGATHFIHLKGNRTSNFAVPVAKGEWATYGHAEEEQQHRSAYGDDMYYQVDVHVSADVFEWERIVFFHSYGDLGMILGLIARNNGLLLGVNGLKIPDQPNPPFLLSTLFSDIMPFFGLSLDTWRRGFQTKLQLFEWVATSRFFNPAFFRTKGDGIRKVKEDRKMYAEFVAWVESERERRRADGLEQQSSPRKDPAEIVNEALVYFNKKEEFDNLALSRKNRTRFKAGFNGNNVNEWAGMEANWRGVKQIMDSVRARLGGDNGVVQFLDESGEEELRKIVLEVRDQLGLAQGDHGVVEELARTSVTQA